MEIVTSHSSLSNTAGETTTVEVNPEGLGGPAIAGIAAAAAAVLGGMNYGAYRWGKSNGRKEEGDHTCEADSKLRSLFKSLQKMYKKEEEEEKSKKKESKKE